MPPDVDDPRFGKWLRLTWEKSALSQKQYASELSVVSSKPVCSTDISVLINRPNEARIGREKKDAIRKAALQHAASRVRRSTENLPS